MYYKFNKLNIKNFNGKNVDAQVCFLKNTLKTTLDDHIPVISKQIKRLDQPKWMTTELKTFFKFNERNEEYKTMRYKVLYEVKAAKNNYYKFIINHASGNSKKIWRSKNKISGKQNARIPRKCTLLIRK